MRLFAFDANSGRPLTRWVDEKGAAHRVDPKTSKVVISPIAATAASHVLCFHVGAGGFIPRHPAVLPQLFAVVSGSGWVSGEDGTKVAIGAGRAAYWDAGEQHGAGSDEGMTVIVIEGDGFDPATMREVTRR